MLRIQRYYNFFALPFRAQFVIDPGVALYFAFKGRWCRIGEGYVLCGDYRGWGRWRWLYLWLLIPLGWLAGVGCVRARVVGFVKEFKADVFGRR